MKLLHISNYYQCGIAIDYNYYIIVICRYRSIIHDEFNTGNNYNWLFITTYFIGSELILELFYIAVYQFRF